MKGPNRKRSTTDANETARRRTKVKLTTERSTQRTGEIEGQQERDQRARPRPNEEMSRRGLRRDHPERPSGEECERAKQETSTTNANEEAPRRGPKLSW